MELFKVRICVLVLLTTSAGYFLGLRHPANASTLLAILVGTGLVSAAGCALNQLIERHIDARMRRTANRPLPAGRLGPAEVLALGIVLGVTGIVLLAATVSLSCSLVAAMTLFSYVLVYTPMKQKTPLALLVGAVPGALPPIIGWVGAGGGLNVEGAVLFGILFLWQLPHFLAIGWIYRKQYAMAGLPVLATRDPSGRRTGIQSIVWSSLLFVWTLVPVIASGARDLYLGGAVVLGAAYVLASAAMLRHRSDREARWLFRVSLLYLPLLLGLLVYDRLTL